MTEKQKYTVAVGTLRKPKLQAVEKAFHALPFFADKEIEIIPCDVLSGVSDMPISREEGLSGAYNRAWNCRKKGVEADFYVGMEGGMEKIEINHKDHYFLNFYNYITDGHQDSYSGATLAELPENVVYAVLEEGKEIGEVFDKMVSKEDIRSHHGAIGEITFGIIQREDAFYFGLVPALSKLINPLYP
jgi:inosine/xanthosine triphosphatase